MNTMLIVSRRGLYADEVTVGSVPSLVPREGERQETGKQYREPQSHGPGHR